MCGRFVLSSTPAEIADRFELEEMPEWSPRYNIAPTQRIPIIRAPDGTRECSLARWGLIPAWSKEPKTEYSTFIVRARWLPSSSRTGEAVDRLSIGEARRHPLREACGFLVPLIPKF